MGLFKRADEKWEADLTITSDYITKNIVFKLLINQEIIGYYSLIPIDATTIELDNLFIHPAHMGKGYGSLLLEDAITKSQEKGYTTMKLYADPHATDFYSKKCFVIIDKLETAIPNRYLPIMEKKL